MTDAFSMLVSMIQGLGDAIVNTQFFQSYGLVVLLFWSFITVVILPIPIEIPITTLLYAHFNILLIFVTAWASIYLGTYIFYLILLSGKIAIHRTTIFEEIDDSHFLYTHRWILFSLAPMVYFVGDGAIIYAAYKHMPFSNFALPLIIGSFGRAVIAILISLGLLAIPSFL